ncbi:MAG: FkbM family methyltransferase [Sedimentisphaerales bacterium]|nr:FkbM family methyltransferase [Sedimentisphaerales bacterium]
MRSIMAPLASHIPEPIKCCVRPISRPLFRYLHLKNLRRQQQQQQKPLEEAYRRFCQMSRNEGIQAIVFQDGKSQIHLSDGRRFHFDANDEVARMYSVPYDGTFEAKETEFVRSLVKPGWLCMDVGASFGWYTVLLSRLAGDTGQVHGFEPVPHTCEILRSNVRLNKCENVIINQCALDEIGGPRDIYVPDIGVSGSLSLAEYDKDYDVIQCTCRRLDDYCDEQGINHIDFIKADIEGAEWPMLKGGDNILKKSRPVLFLEVQEHSTRLFNYQTSDLFHWLSERGYMPYYLDDQSNLIPLDDIQKSLPDYNFFFLPQ